MREFDSIRIAIHYRPGSFSERWIEYCEEHRVIYSLLDCYNSDILEQLKPFYALLWHWHQDDTKASFFARQLIVSLENMDIHVFPDRNTCWHYDDKVGKKYLLESIEAPLVPSYVFYDRNSALDWVAKTNFPKVFKLRGGAGSSNVRLIRNCSEAIKICKIAFGRGFEGQAGYFSDFSTKLKKAHRKKDYLGKIKRLPSSLLNIALRNRMLNREKGYVYFQDFIPNNDHDTRVTVVGNRAFAFRRMVRENDFRASGSGDIDYDLSKINIKCISIAFEAAEKLQTQSMAFDFVESVNSTPLIVEVSYCYDANAVKACSGYWDKELNWHERSMWPQDAILEDILQQITRGQSCIK